MADLGSTYDATGGEMMGERGALPAGEYVAALVKSDRVPAKANPRNEYVSCEFEVQDGQHQGRRFWTMLNLWNDNSQAVEIAQRELNSIMHACGKIRVRQTDELHGIPMRVKLKVKTDAQYGDKNTVASYAPLNGGAAAPAHHQPAAAAGALAPWRQAR